MHGERKLGGKLGEERERVKAINTENHTSPHPDRLGAIADKYGNEPTSGQRQRFALAHREHAVWQLNGEISG